MTHFRLNILSAEGLKKLGIVLLFAFTGAASFATLGDGKKSADKPKTSLLSDRTINKPGSFSLKSGYNFRGNTILNTASDKKTIRLNTVVTVQKGRTTFTVPLRKNVVINKVKLDLGNRQFQHR